jgi:superfamily II DNA or RNA helicase
VSFQAGLRVRVPSRPDLGWVTVDDARDLDGGGVRLYVQAGAHDKLVRLDLDPAEAATVQRLEQDGSAKAEAVLGALWTCWMGAAAAQARSAALAASPLRPYAHQMNAVYGQMLPQPRLRFLLADEPGTGKTIMAGLYLREMQRLGFLRRGLVVAPAHLVSKWQDDFDRFFGGDLRRVTATTVHERALETEHDLWIVSLDLLSVNPAVQEALRPDRRGWDAVVFDEAHRLTPTAQAYYAAGELLAKNTPHALLMTATPHRGKEWLFRALLHLVDHEVYPPSQANEDHSSALKPGRLHFLRRMKEDLVDFDGTTKLFKGRHASNRTVRLDPVEAAYYDEALALVDDYFPPNAVQLAKMVYGKRAASSLHSLAETLERRKAGMGTEMPAAAAMGADPDDEDPSAADEARVVVEGSRSAREERKKIDDMLGRLRALLADQAMPVSKWKPFYDDCLLANGIAPGNGQQAVVFTEYADTANWLVDRIRAAGYSAERYSGQDDHHHRDTVRARFAQRGFQVLVSTDAGNEGIDLQTAHVLVNWDIPWSLVRLEQRMGRIHRVGQTRDVELYNLIATDTREGEVLAVLLGNFVTAANQLEGRMFDSLSLVGELVGLTEDRVARLLAARYGEDETAARAALDQVRLLTADKLTSAAEAAQEQEAALASAVDIAQAVEAMHDDSLERINPAIVEAYLSRLKAAGTVRVDQLGSGDGVYLLSLPGGTPLPAAFARDPGARTGPTEARVVVSGEALAAARAADADLPDAVVLGPSDPAYNALVALSADVLGPSGHQGALLADPTSSTGYDLHAYTGRLVEADGRRTTTWSCLVKTDAAGARIVRWEVLANLLPTGRAAGPPDDFARHDAQQRALKAAADEQQERSAVLGEWLRSAEQQLTRLPRQIAGGIADRDARTRARERLDETVRQRLDDLRAMTSVTVDAVQETAWARVEPGATPPDQAQQDSEAVSTRHVTGLLVDQGWQVADVSRELRGYDLHATKGRDRRLVEVKGVQGAASSSGIEMTGNEVLIATQHRREYWLYVIDNCADGHGTLYGAYPDPVRAFDGLTRDKVLVRVSGSALATARDAEQALA